MIRPALANRSLANRSLANRSLANRSYHKTCHEASLMIRPILIVHISWPLPVTYTVLQGVSRLVSKVSRLEPFCPLFDAGVNLRRFRTNLLLPRLGRISRDNSSLTYQTGI